jgi:hypothetical protein
MWQPIYIEATSERHVRPTNDARFIVTARTAMPKLLSAVENVLALHRSDPAGICHSCEYLSPCPTVRAIESALGGGDDAE